MASNPWGTYGPAVSRSDEPDYSDQSKVNEWVSFLASKGIDPISAGMIKASRQSPDWIMRPGMGGSGASPGVAGEEGENEYRRLFGGSDTVRIGGVEYQRLGQDPNDPNSLFGYGQNQFTGSANNAANQLRQSGQVTYDPRYGWIAPQNTFVDIAKGNFGGGTLFENLAGNLPQIAAGGFLTGGALGGFDQFAAGAGAAAGSAPATAGAVDAAFGGATADAAGLTAADWAGSSIFPEAAATSGGLTPAEWSASGIFGTPGATAGGAGIGGAGTGAVSGTALSRLLGLNQNQSDLASVLGTAGATGLGMYAANQQGNALTDIANQSRADRAPFLNAATGYLNNPQSFIEGPGQAAMKGTLAGLSANFGNPIGSGAALQIATDAGLKNWQNAVTGLGNIGLSGEDTRAQLGAQAAGANSNIYSNLAGGVSDIINPRKSLSDLLKEYKGMGLI